MRLKFATIFLILFAVVGRAKPAFSQDSFDYLDIGLTADGILFGNELLDEWNARPGGGLEIRIPYYSGVLEFGTRYIRYREKTYENSDFRSIFLYTGWSYPLYPADRFSISPGLRAGYHFLRQDREIIYSFPGGGEGYVFNKYEGDFAFELMLRASFKIGEHWILHATSSYNRTVLNHPLSVGHVAVGISGRLRTPEWLRTLLQ